jgi:superfamily II DNA or RNA helicase
VILRDYQADILGQTLALLDSGANPLVQLDTGAGKTPIMAAICKQARYAMVVCHRNELAVQASLKLAAFGLVHDVLGTGSTRRRAGLRHVRAGYGRHIQRGHTNHLVASVQSLLAAYDRGDLTLDTLAPWLLLVDEAHHVQPDNMWGRLREVFPHARIGGFSGTPARLDDGPLHVAHGGLFTDLVQAQSLREDSTQTLIRQGYLADFVCYAPTSAEGLGRTKSNFFVAGETLELYRRWAKGQTIVICNDINHARTLAEEFRAAGVAADYIASSRGGTANARVLDGFERQDIRVMCAVDMVSEGFDCPDAQTLILTRHTQSFVMYRQWVGRILRPLEGVRKTIIDQAGLIYTHGMPHTPVKWDLLNPPACAHKLRHLACPACGLFYKVDKPACPGCGEANALLARTAGGVCPQRGVVPVMDMQFVVAAQTGMAAQALAKRLEASIVWPTDAPHDTSLMGRAVQGLCRWYAEALQSAGVPCSQINAFLRSKQAFDARWWIEAGFVAADTKGGKAAKTKALKGHAQWLKLP